MLTRDDNELLTRSGPGTPMGELMRRYWIPALLSEEIPEPDGSPVRTQLLGEELVAFRDTLGRVGLLAEHCAHRGTSLFYGRNEECGLRCIYHGWKYDVDGTVLDTPAEPAGSRFKEKVQQTSYPTHEAAGIVFAYMGPRDKMPQFPNYEWATAPKGTTHVTKSLQDCNYLQGVEGECDTTHLQFLHRSLLPNDRAREMYRFPLRDYVIERADFGMRLVAVREAEGGKSYVRASSFVLPIDCWVPARTSSVHFYIPAGDDSHSWRLNLRFRIPSDEQPDDSAPFWDANYRKLRNINNHYLQDREAQRSENYTGMGQDFVIHDSCATETMGPIYERAREHLGSSDRAVVAVRAFLVQTVKAFQRGEEPPNLVMDPARNQFDHVDTFAKVINHADWRAAFPHLTPTSSALSGAGVA